MTIEFSLPDFSFFIFDQYLFNFFIKGSHEDYFEQLTLNIIESNKGNDEINDWIDQILDNQEKIMKKLWKN